MKNYLMILTALTTFSTSAFAAEMITCSLAGKTEVVVTLKHLSADIYKHEGYSLTLDEALATSYAPVEEEYVFVTDAKNADYLADWDGNKGEDLYFEKGFLSSAVGSKSKARVRAYYNDIEEDSLSTNVECVIVK